VDVVHDVLERELVVEEDDVQELELDLYCAKGLEVVHHLLVAFSQSTKHVKFGKHFRVVKHVHMEP
jgi:hypothetical protein